jgi:hypothetical protein
VGDCADACLPHYTKRTSPSGSILCFSECRFVNEELCKSAHRFPCTESSQAAAQPNTCGACQPARLWKPRIGANGANTLCVANCDAFPFSTCLAKNRYPCDGSQSLVGGCGGPLPGFAFAQPLPNGFDPAAQADERTAEVDCGALSAALCAELGRQPCGQAAGLCGACLPARLPQDAAAGEGGGEVGLSPCLPLSVGGIPAWVLWASLAVLALGSMLALFFKWKEALALGQAAVAVKVLARCLSLVSFAVWAYRAEQDAAAFPDLSLAGPTTAATVCYTVVTLLAGAGTVLALACAERPSKGGFGAWAQDNKMVKRPCFVYEPFILAAALRRAAIP